MHITQNQYIGYKIRNFLQLKTDKQGRVTTTHGRKSMEGLGELIKDILKESNKSNKWD